MPATNARLVDAAIAAVSLLNLPATQTSLVKTFAAARGYEVPTYDLKNEQALGVMVTVIAAELDESPFSRGTIQGLLSIDVGIQNAVQSLADKDTMMLLVEQIKTVLEKGLVLPEPFTDCGWQGTENSPIYDPDHLQEFGVFTSVPRFKYLTRRPR